MVGNSTLQWIKSVVESGADHKPFFAYMGPHAPHLPSTPAPWYADHPVGNTPVPKQIYYNYSGVGKHAFGALPSLAAQNVAIDEAAIALEHSNRLKTLLSVDDIVGALHSYLVSVNEWDNTYWLQTSDHGALECCACVASWQHGSVAAWLHVQSAEVYIYSTNVLMYPC